MTLTKSANKFATVLGRYMRANGLSIPDMAERAEVTRGAVYSWLDGTSLPPRRRALRLAAVMGRKDLPGLIARIRSRAAARSTRAAS